MHRAGLQRSELFVTSKLRTRDNGYQQATIRIREAIRSIWGGEGDGYLDCFLIHYPGYGRPLDAWRAMHEARSAGLLRHIGVSNFEIPHLEKLERKTGEFPEVNQIEFHPWIHPNQREMVQFCKERRIALEGYSPLAQARHLDDPVLAAIASRCKTTPARVVLKWCMQHGVKPIFGSRNPEHIRTNAQAYHFKLSADEMGAIDELGRAKPVRVSLQWHWNPPEASMGQAPPWRHPMRAALRLLRRTLGR